MLLPVFDVQICNVNNEYYEALHKAHKAKMDCSDYIYILNVNGYVGADTQREIDYAKSKGMTIEYLCPDW